jgi:hypothetical protein
MTLLVDFNDISQKADFIIALPEMENASQS